MTVTEGRAGPNNLKPCCKHGATKQDLRSGREWHVQSKACCLMQIHPTPICSWLNSSPVLRRISWLVRNVVRSKPDRWTVTHQNTTRAPQTHTFIPRALQRAAQSDPARNNGAVSMGGSNNASLWRLNWARWWVSQEWIGSFSLLHSLWIYASVCLKYPFSPSKL